MTRKEEKEQKRLDSLAAQINTVMRREIERDWATQHPNTQRMLQEQVAALSAPRSRKRK